MAVNKQVNFIMCLSVMLRNIGLSISSKFTKFYSKRIFDVDLAPSKTFAYDFTLGNNSSSIHRKSLEKLRGLFTKYLSKVNPAIQLTVQDFIQMGQNNSSFTVNLFNVYYGLTLPEFNLKKMSELMISAGHSVPADYVPSVKGLHQDPTEENCFFNSIPEILKIQRYVRYLNYLNRKYDIPLQLEIDRTFTWENDSMDSSGKCKVTVNAHFMGWFCRSNEALERYKAIKETGVEDDTLFSNFRNWTCSGLNNDGNGGADYGYHVAKIFLHLDKVLNVLGTLSRKVEYGYSAFTFRT